MYQGTADLATNYNVKKDRQRDYFIIDVHGEVENSIFESALNFSDVIMIHCD